MFKSFGNDILIKYLGATTLLIVVHTLYVAKDECPPNEEYLLCGTACPFNCTNPEGPVSCTDDCVEGCFCKSGFLRDANGTCVSADKCAGGKTQVCDENEEFLSCGTACPLSCGQPESALCGLACSMGCFCKAGYLRDETTNKCVTYDQCPSDQCFNANEVYDVCNAGCEPSCGDPEPICSKVCTSGCVCAAGLLRSVNGDCVSVDRCPQGNNTDPTLLDKYLTVINKILHLSAA